MRLSSPRARASSSRRRWITSPPPSIFTSLFSLSKIVNPSFRNEIFSFRRINLFILMSIPFPPPLLPLTYLLSRFTRGFMRFKCFCLQDYLCFIFDCFRVPIFFSFLRKEGRRRGGELKGKNESERETRR